MIPGDPMSDPDENPLSEVVEHVRQQTGTSVLLTAFRAAVDSLKEAGFSNQVIMRSISEAVSVLQTGMSVAELESGCKWGE